MTPLEDEANDNVSVPLPPMSVSLPPPPSMVSLPSAPSMTFAALLPVSVSLNAEPMRFSMFEIVSLPAAPLDVPLPRLTVTAPLASA